MSSFLGMSYLEKYPENMKKLILIDSISTTFSDFNNDELNKIGLSHWKRQEVLDTLKAHNLKVED